MSVHQKTRIDEDDDLDDLDDVLDQFSPAALPASPPPPPASASASTSSRPVDTDEGLMDDFADNLAKEMESLFKGLGIESRAGLGGADEAPERERLAAAWEAMLVEDMDAMSGLSNARPVDGPKEDDFQSRIRSTMNKLKESESGLKSSDSPTSGGGETLQSLLSQLEGLGGLSDDGTESEGQLQGVLEAMMGQLMSKDVLYEPLKELHDKFPGYLTEHSTTISLEDKERYGAQISCIKRLLDEFEAKSYRDDDDEARGKIVELMGELQTHGSPPEEIMGPLPPGFSMGTDGLPNVPEGCGIN